VTISVKKEFGQRNNEEVRPRCFFGAKSKQSKTAYKQTHKFYIPVFLKLALKTLNQAVMQLLPMLSSIQE